MSGGHGGPLARPSWSVAVLLACLVLGAGVSVGVGAAQAAEVPRLPECGNVGYGGDVAPTQWSSACLGGSANTVGLVWSAYGGPVADASGTIRLNDCDPSCAEGTIFDYPVALHASEVRTCPSALGLAPFYTSVALTVTYPADNPFGKAPGPEVGDAFALSCGNAGFEVSTGSKEAAFGAFAEGDGQTIGAFDSLYGEPTSTRRGQGRCAKRWWQYGMTITSTTYGQDLDPCTAGYFSEALLDGTRWTTAAGVRPGSPVAAARRAAKRTCRRTECFGHRPGLVLALHRSECAAGRYPGVIAEVRGGRVARLVVQSYGCE